MKKIIKSIFLGIFAGILAVSIISASFAQTENQCFDQKQDTQGYYNKCDLKLNTNIPFIGNCVIFSPNKNPQRAEVYVFDHKNDNGKYCYKKQKVLLVSQGNTFGILVAGLSKILLTLFYILSFLMVVAGSVMMILGGMNGSYRSQGKKMIGKAITAIAVLGLSGILLKLINPFFFK